jgi:hypothetical protein
VSIAEPNKFMAFSKSESLAKQAPDSRLKAAKEGFLGCWWTAKPSTNTPDPDFEKTMQISFK